MVCGFHQKEKGTAETKAVKSSLAHDAHEKNILYHHKMSVFAGWQCTFSDFPVMSKPIAFP